MAVSRNTAKHFKQQGLLSFIGTALPGTDKRVRGRHIAAEQILSNDKSFVENISSAGGFTILGKNAFGQDVARSNVTGRVATVDAFSPISPESRAIGPAPTPKSAARKADVRRTGGEKTTSLKKRKPLGSSSILGGQSILG